MLKSIETHFNNRLPFVVFRTPNSQLVKYYLQNDAALIEVDDFTEQGFVFAPFKESTTNKIVIFKTSNCEVDSFEIKEKTIRLNSDLTQVSQTALPDSYQSLINAAFKTISDNNLQKVVLSRPFSFEIENINPILIFENLLNSYPSAFVYCWHHPKVGTWLGASPETLLHIKGARLSAMSLAGTQKVESNTEANWTPKELNEQNIVTKYIINQLEKSGVPSEQIISNKVSTIRAGNLWHLQTKIEAVIDLSKFSLNYVLQYLHPTPAVCGEPKDTALQFIENHESYNRAYYAGFLGEINILNTTERNKRLTNVENSAYKSVGKQTRLFVNLRCMQMIDHQAIIYVGGGITKDSKPENEWQELLAKLQTVKSVL